MVARKPYLIQTLRTVAAYLYNFNQTDDLICGILSALFQLKFRLLWCNSDFNYIGLQLVVFYQFYKFIHIGYRNIVKSHIGTPLITWYISSNKITDKCDRLCKNWPCSHLVVIRDFFKGVHQYKAAKPPLRKADHLSLAIGDMVFG